MEKRKLFVTQTENILKMMLTKILTKAALLSTILTLVYACESNVEEEVIPETPTTQTEAPPQKTDEPKETPSTPETPENPTTPENPVEPPTVTVISFAQSVKPIIDVNCVECHGGNNFPDLRNISSIQSSASRIKSQVESRRMPLGNKTLTSAQIKTITDWIDAGALNN